MEYINKLKRKIKNSLFLKDPFVWGMIFLSVLFFLAFLYYTKLKLSDFKNAGDASLTGLGYEFISDGGSLYQIPIFIAIFSILNILGSKIIYSYDILASYLLIVSVTILNALYFFGTFIFLS